MTTFNDLKLATPILKALEEEGYASPTPIQAQAIPALMLGRDLLGIAQTGTGKTAAFALPILHRLATDRRAAPRRGARVLVLSPTRELASQIAESFRSYGRHLGLKTAVIFGGVGHGPQADALRSGLDVLIATPGRLIDHIEQRNASLETTEVLVLDEADQMLDLGFVKPIRRIVSKLSTRRQNLFFSATMPPEIGALASEMLVAPVRVSVTPASTTVERVEQRVIHVDRPRKAAVLVDLLGDPAMTRTLIFTRTKRGADRVARHLEASRIGAAAIHGNKSQRQREIALQDFKDGRVRVLVATDIAARGIDVEAVSHVINYELPDVPENYVHRIGRTARAGANGIAISLVDGEERDNLRAIQKLTRQAIPVDPRRSCASPLPASQASEPADAGRSDRTVGRRHEHARRPGRDRHQNRSDSDRASSPRHGRANATGVPDAGRRGRPAAGGQAGTGGRRSADHDRNDARHADTGLGAVAFLTRPVGRPARAAARPGARQRT